MSGLLLDTHVLLWWAENPAQISGAARMQIEDPQRDIFVSVATVWEIGIKQASGKLQAPSDIPGLLRANRFQPLVITLEHAQAAAQLPAYHRDPFDRMLVAQAQEENLQLVTADRTLMRYGIGIVTA